MIQKTATDEESIGEVDKNAAPLSDRTASLDLSKDASTKIEGSGVDDVDAEGVRHLYSLESMTERLFLFVFCSPSN